ncbi:hypothetical protein B0J13DRAFT_601738 [Dactylonectria estremocensis]|uniref:Extracellular membrane protein CFEM domain-containing protein n=1 Tax=Dactylonectria estremocensis TaxID=1079267 RepID=A0A9P9FJ47_9HYPO|nr:hypothetical protein B0J13DRAFT_601738 [Dactylonectria estremocensis]
MRSGNSIRPLMRMIATAIFMLASLIPQSTAISDPGRTFTIPHQGRLVRRAEDAGSSCDSEGQWNCMTDSWQRCASGEWSKEIQCAEGTRCTPLGLTDNFTVEHDANATETGTSGSSVGPQTLMDGRVVLAISGLWAFLTIVQGMF